MAKNKKAQSDKEIDVTLSFGDPIPVHSDNITDYLNVVSDISGKYFLPPIDLTGLSKMNRANGMHGSCVYSRRNMLANSLQYNKLLSYQDFKACASDFITFGNAYIQIIRSRVGNVLKLQHVPALNVRRMTNNNNQYCILQNGKTVEFMPHEIMHFFEYDTAQNIYGIPDWIGSMQSALLNQDATLFKRKYFKNGAHLGNIFYSRDPKLSKKAQTALKEKIAQGKGVGNFRSMFLHIDNGAEDAIKIIPVGDISQKDQFDKIKSITETDVLVAHRMQPVLMGVIPENVGGFSKPTEAKENYIDIEVRATAQNFLKINELLPRNQRIKFKLNTDILG